MAIAGIPQNFVAQTGNQTNQLSWDYVASATSYSIQVSSDNFITTTTYTTTTNHYLDSAVTIGILYSYQVASVNASGTSGYCDPISVVPAPTGEMALLTLRQSAQQKADRLNSQFVTTQEWNQFINLACTELYDLLITVYEDYFMAPRVQFTATGSTSIYPLPNGTLQFNSYPNQGPLFTAAPFYKLLGVDLGLNNAQNAFVTINKYMLRDRNSFIYPNTASTIYGVFNLQYRLLGTNIEFIPQPSGGQVLQLLYIPRLPELLADTDITTIGFSGWLNYVIVRAAKYALDKEESDTTKLDNELGFIQKRIEESAPNRDAGQPERITNARSGQDWGNGGFGQNGAIGGY